MRRSPRMVVLRALGLGDLLTAVPAVRALVRARPQESSFLALPRPLHPLARSLRLVDAVTHADPLGPIATHLARPRLAVNLHGRGPQSHRRLAELRPHRMLAFRNVQCPESYDGPAWRDDEHERDRWCRLLRHYGIPADPTDFEIPRPDRRPPAAAVGATLIHPGAASPARRWPPERYAAVARRERERGRPVVVTGDRREVGLATQISDRAGLPRSSVLAGSTDVVDLAAAVGAAGRVVCGDTGVAHLATALSTPSVVLFGPTPPSRWGPPDRPWHRALWAGTEGDPHAQVVDPGLVEIGTDDVDAELAALPPRPGRSGRPGDTSAEPVDGAGRGGGDGLSPRAGAEPARGRAAPAGATARPRGAR